MPHDERRQQILEAAAELFAQRGFAGTTTRQIAAAARTSETVLFRHFPTKESLYGAILEHRVPAGHVERWLRELHDIAARHDDEALFAAVAEAILESFHRDAVYHRLMLFAALEGHELARIVQAKYSGPLVSFLREHVTRRQADGAFKRTRPEWVVHMLVGTAAYYGQWKALGVNPLGLTDREVAAEVVTLLAGLGVRS